MDACCVVPQHLIILGGGSAAFAAAIRATELGARVTMINDGLPIGGTCVNVGCVPSKNLIRAAEAFHRAAHPNFPGIETRARLSDFRKIIEQKRELVLSLRKGKYIDVIKNYDNVRIVEGRGKLVDANTVEVNGETLHGDRILIATGASPFVPDIPGLSSVDYLTNQTAFELEELPASLIVLGGRYIALETAQMFARFGSKVTILQRSPRILPTELPDVTDELTEHLTAEGLQVVTGVKLERVEAAGKGIRVTARVKGELETFEAEKILVATGRRPNTADMGLEQVGVQLNEKGFVVVDDTLQTTVPGIYAAGDVLGENMFVYAAAYEGKLAAENAINGEGKKRDYTAMPWVIFTDPQVAGVGMDERQARENGIDAEATLLPLSEVPRALAARDSRGFIKLIRDRQTDRLVGARIVAAEGSELLMEVALAIKFGITVEQIKDMFHPYLTLSEGVKLAAITFAKDVHQLSCCAT
ncbi:MAG: mercury(II) reductase [Calditrichaeota bacterium]|nr:MAG: mercury(II) reductase [Calditrichota bacterium]